MLDRTALAQRILHYLENADLDRHLANSRDREDPVFDELALAVFGYQYVHNPAYRRLCVYRQQSPATVQRWQDIPPVAAASFKVAPLFCGMPETALRVFETSGTTHGVPGKHYFRTLDFYRVAALRTFKWACLPDRRRMPILVLGPTADFFPESSLGQMFSWILQEHGSPGSLVPFSPDRIDFAAATRWLVERARRNDAVLILATSLALAAWIESEHFLAADLRLPDGSRIIDTGGTKGAQKQIDRAAFLRMVSARFGLPPAAIFNEYGMTELSSQFYESAAIAEKFGAGVKVGPPWLRSLACDPETLQPMPDGEFGALRHFDLANLDSVAMLQTEDIGSVHGRALVLRGRQLGAEPRGCSLLAEQIFATQDGAGPTTR